MSEDQQAQLNYCAWYLEEEKKTEDAINHIRNVRGTFETDRNVTYHWLEGYLAGLKRMYRKFEDGPK